MFSRRGLFGLLAGGAVATATLDPELALWIPKKKVYSIPAPQIVKPGEGMSVRHIRYYDTKTGLWVSRLDILAGFYRVDWRDVVHVLVSA